MKINQMVLKAAENFADRFPGESHRIKTVLDQIADPTIGERSNMVGHVTTSLLAVNRSRNRVMLIHHLFLDRWLTPGGHFEGDESLWASASREFREETGYTGEITPLLDHPIDIDSHCIPGRPAKGETEHYHHDFMFLAEIDDSFTPIAQEEEVAAAQWRDFIDLEDHRTFNAVGRAHNHKLI